MLWTVLKEDLDNNKIYISAQDKFIEGEAIVGATSNARGLLNDYQPNPISKYSTTFKL